jgi:tail accessory factor
MTTAIQIISRALRLIGVADAAEAIEANDAQDALETLNAMLAEWHEAEIGLPDYALATTETELASDAADREAIAYQLALRIAPEYGKTVQAEFVVAAETTMARLRLRYFQPGCTDFRELPSRRLSFNIETGE